MPQTRQQNAARHRVFVYGTLKRGFPNHATLAQPGAVFLATARTRLPYPLVIQGQWFSPVLVPEPGCGLPVTGELWDVDDAMLAALDRLESVHLPTGYDRTAIEVERIGGTPARRDSATEIAWTYFKRRERITVIHSEPMADYQDHRYVPAHLRPR